MARGNIFIVDIAKKKYKFIETIMNVGVAIMQYAKNALKIEKLMFLFQILNYFMQFIFNLKKISLKL